MHSNVMKLELPSYTLNASPRLLHEDPVMIRTRNSAAEFALKSSLFAVAHDGWMEVFQKEPEMRMVELKHCFVPGDEVLGASSGYTSHFIVFNHTQPKGGETASAPFGISEIYVDLNVFVVPRRLFDDPYHSASLENVLYESSMAGFIRVPSNSNMLLVRDAVKDQLGHENIPDCFVFLRSVGRCLSQVNQVQERQLKAIDFAPPNAEAPEVFLLESNEVTSPQRLTSPEQMKAIMAADDSRDLELKDNKLQLPLEPIAPPSSTPGSPRLGSPKALPPIASDGNKSPSGMSAGFYPEEAKPLVLSREPSPTDFNIDDSEIPASSQALPAGEVPEETALADNQLREDATLATDPLPEEVTVGSDQLCNEPPKASEMPASPKKEPSPSASNSNTSSPTKSPRRLYSRRGSSAPEGGSRASKSPLSPRLALSPLAPISPKPVEDVKKHTPAAEVFQESSVPYIELVDENSDPAPQAADNGETKLHTEDTYVKPPAMEIVPATPETSTLQAEPSSDALSSSQHLNEPNPENEVDTEGLKQEQRDEKRENMKKEKRKVVQDKVRERIESDSVFPQADPADETELVSTSTRVTGERRNTIQLAMRKRFIEEANKRKRAELERASWKQLQIANNDTADRRDTVISSELNSSSEADTEDNDQELSDATLRLSAFHERGNYRSEDRKSVRSPITAFPQASNSVGKDHASKNVAFQGTDGDKFSDNATYSKEDFSPRSNESDKKNLGFEDDSMMAKLLELEEMKLKKAEIRKQWKREEMERAAQEERENEEKRLRLENLRNQLEKSKAERVSLTKNREALVKQVRTLSAEVELKGTQTSNSWRKKYVQEKKRTEKLEEERSRLKREIELLHQRLSNSDNYSTGGNSISGFDIRRGGEPSEKSNHQNLIHQLQQDCDHLKARIENTSRKLGTETKMRELAQQELKELREKKHTMLGTASRAKLAQKLVTNVL